MLATMPMKKQNRLRYLLFLFSAASLLLAAGLLASLKWGQAPVSWRDLWEAVTYRGQEAAQLYVQTLRLPRALTAGMVGVQLALAGLLTQLGTRNPLASPHLFGINAGAAFAVVFGLVAVPGISSPASVLFAFAGAAGGAALVWALAGSGRSAHVRTALAGIAVHFLLSSLTEGLIILNNESTDSMMFWLVGSVSHASWPDVRLLLPFFAGGLLLFGLMLPSFRLLLVEDEVAAGLGQRIVFVRGVAMLLVLALSGSAVSICGPIGFVCLIVPHIARALVGPQLGALVPLTGLLGGALLLIADFAGRFVAFPYESPVGIVTGAVGALFFIYLARRKGGGMS